MSYFRHHEEHKHLSSAFGDDWFAKKAEAFARFFGTPTFIIIQTVIVAIWCFINVMGPKFLHFDEYPFVFLNLAFSLQAAYAAPLILLAQTRQADRDKAHADADAKHREELAKMAHERQELLVQMVDQNTQMTQQIKALNEKIATLTTEVHARTVPPTQE